MRVPSTPKSGRPSAQLQRVQPSNSLKLSLQGSLSCRKPPHPGPSFPEVAQREGAAGVYTPSYLTQSRPALTSHLAPKLPVGWGHRGCGQSRTVAPLPLPNSCFRLPLLLTSQRTCHMMTSQSRLPGKQVSEVWEHLSRHKHLPILGVSLVLIEASFSYNMVPEHKPMISSVVHPKMW